VSNDRRRYSEFTYDEVLTAAAVFTLSPSDLRWVDVQTAGERQAEQLKAFEARLATTERRR
jgi:hypothetical protein